MKRRNFISLAATTSMLAPGIAAQPRGAQQLHPGIWRFTFGAPEKITPTATRRYPAASPALEKLPPAGACPVTPQGTRSPRGYVVTLPLAPREIVYGFGLQLQSFIQRGSKKKLRVNADPRIDSGDSHAPVPFYLTTNGYGVFIDTARYATFYCGNTRRAAAATARDSAKDPAAPDENLLPAAYRANRMGEPGEILVEIPVAAGVDVYIFAGPTMRAAVQRYNLFAGGGALPPRWGLGIWYRCDGGFDQAAVLKMADNLRARRIPCDVLGLEPGWQSHAYSCSFVWSGKFPAPQDMVQQLTGSHYRVNLWEHAYTHPSSPLHNQLLGHSGDYEVWDGLVPDFISPETQQIFGRFQEREHVSIGVSGYKLDECDNSDFTGSWSFPELSRFPSGADGEQMHSMFGMRYMDAIQRVFDQRKTRTYGLVRSAGALAAPYPYALYSDLYDHAEFVRALAKIGFSGLLWTPELRDARNTEDLIRRLQSTVLSPLALINAWYIKNPPWMQVQAEKNNAGELDPDWETVEAQCRRVMELRMRLVPYLHAAFVRYHNEGVPPFRALVLDFPEDARTWAVDDQYLMGESLMIAPLVAGSSDRRIYLPDGEWFDYWSGRRYTGKQQIHQDVPLEQIPIFAKAGTLLPLAQPTLHTDDPESFAITAHVFAAPGGAPANGVNYVASLYEDDGSTPAGISEVRLTWEATSRSGAVHRSGPSRGPAYRVIEWKLIG